MRTQYGYDKSDPLSGAVKVSGVPKIDLERVEVTAHARERLKLMRAQAAVTFDEILLTLKAPLRVRFVPDHGTWLWIGERIAIAGSHTDGSTSIVTILWTTKELWDANPRPSQEG
ncbi:hypothetical protein [Microbacterium sp. YY-01]|uniref:hypothetical protein n=1 Tax=Microbacterium sp. YY-01 TaxID=3421634 RepID=UPI003D176B97